MGDPTAPNQGATGDVSAEEAAARAGDAPFPGATPQVDVGTADGDAFSNRPELFVAGAFIGGFALAQILKRVRR